MTEAPRIYVADTKLNKLEQKEIEFVQGLFKKTFTSFGESLPRVFWMRDQEGGSAIISNVAVVAPTEWQQQFQPVSRSYIPDHNVSETDLQVVTWVVKSKRSVNFDAYVTMITGLCDYQKERAARMSQQVRGDLLSVEEEGLTRLNDPKGLVCEELKQSLTIGPYEDGDTSSPEILAYIDARIYYLRNLLDSGLFDDTNFCQTILLVMSTLMSQVPTRQRLASVKVMAGTLTELRDDLTHLIENVMMFLLLGCQEPESLSLPASARFSASGLSSSTLAQAISGGITGLRVRPVTEAGLKQILESPSGICVQILTFHRVFYRLFPSTSGIRMEFDENPFFYFKDSCAHPIVPPLATPNQYSHYGKTLVSTIQQNPAHIDKLVCIHGWLLELARLVVHSDNLIYISGTSPSLLGYRPVVKAVERTLRAQEDYVIAIADSINQLRQLTKQHPNIYEVSTNLVRSLSVLTHRCSEKSQKLQKQLKSSLFRCRSPETSAVLPLEIQDLILQSSILSGKSEIFLNVRPQAVDFSAPARALQPLSVVPTHSLDWDQVLHRVRRRQLSLYKRELQSKALPLLQAPSTSFEPSPITSRVPPPPPPPSLMLDSTTTSPTIPNTTSGLSPSKLTSTNRARAYSPTTMKNFLTYLEKEIHSSGMASDLKNVEAITIVASAPVVLKGRELTKAERLFIRAMAKNWSTEEQPAIVSRHYQTQGELHLHNGNPLLAIECFTRALELLPQRAELAHAIATARSSSPVLIFSQRSAGLETGEVACQLLLCQTLTHVDLTGNQLGSLAIPSLFTVFRWLPDLTTLSLGSNHINDEGLKSVVAFLNDSALTQLDISSNNITSTGAQHLAAALVTNRTLQHLDVSGNHIEEVGASAFCVAWFSNAHSALEVLDLRNTGLDSAISVDTMRGWIKQSNVSDAKDKDLEEIEVGDEGSNLKAHRRTEIQSSVSFETVDNLGRWLLVSLSKQVQVELTLEEGLLPLRGRLIPPHRDSLVEAVQQIQDELTYVSPCPIWSNGGFDVSQPQLQEFFEQRFNSHVSSESSLNQRSISPQNSPNSVEPLYKGPSLLRWFCALEASRPRKPTPDVDRACRDLLRVLYNYQIERCQSIGEWLSVKDHFALNDPMNAFCEEWKDWLLRLYSGAKLTDEMDRVSNRLTFLHELSGLCSGIRAQVVTDSSGRRRMGPRVPFAPRQWPSLLPLASPQFTALLEQMSNILVQYLTCEQMEHVRKSYYSPVSSIVLSAPHLLEVCLLFLFLVYRNPAIASPAECTSLSIALLRANLRDNLDFAKPAHSSSGQLFMHLLKSSPLEFFFPSVLQVPSLDLAVIDFENPFWDPSGAPRLPRGV